MARTLITVMVTIVAADHATEPVFAEVVFLILIGWTLLPVVRPLLPDEDAQTEGETEAETA